MTDELKVKFRTHGWVMLWGALAAYLFVTKGKDDPMVLAVLLYAFAKWEIADLKTAWNTRKEQDNG